MIQYNYVHYSTIIYTAVTLKCTAVPILKAKQPYFGFQRYVGEDVGGRRGGHVVVVN